MKMWNAMGLKVQVENWFEKLGGERKFTKIRALRKFISTDTEPYKLMYKGGLFFYSDIFGFFLAKKAAQLERLETWAPQLDYINNGDFMMISSIGAPLWP